MRNKEIVCSGLTLTALRYFQCALEVAFGKVEIRNFTFWGAKDPTDPKPWVKVKSAVKIGKTILTVEGKFRLCGIFGGYALCEERHELTTEHKGEYDFYFAHWHSDQQVFKIANPYASHLRRLTWLVGTDANNRWAEPLFKYSDAGLHYDI